MFNYGKFLLLSFVITLGSLKNNKCWTEIIIWMYFNVLPFSTNIYIANLSHSGVEIYSMSYIYKIQKSSAYCN